MHHMIPCTQKHGYRHQDHICIPVGTQVMGKIRKLAAILDLCKFDTFPPLGFSGTFSMLISTYFWVQKY